MHTLLKITEVNKPYIIRRYTDYIVSRMDSLQILEEFKNYFYREKLAYLPETLETEIDRYCPEILEDHLIENVVGAGSEFSNKSYSQEDFHVQTF